MGGGVVTTIITLRRVGQAFEKSVYFSRVHGVISASGGGSPGLHQSTTSLITAVPQSWCPQEEGPFLSTPDMFVEMMHEEQRWTCLMLLFQGEKAHWLGHGHFLADSGGAPRGGLGECPAHHAQLCKYKQPVSAAGVLVSLGS